MRLSGVNSGNWHRWLQMQSTYWLEKVLKVISLYVNSILRIDTAELHRVYDNKLQLAQKCIDVQGDNLQHLL